jgi:hypothetical protein
MPAKPPPDWITAAVLHARLVAESVPVTAGQLERWTGAGLLRPRRRQFSDPRIGSVVWYPPTAFEQIRQAEDIRPRRFAHVGFVLWWRGFEVAEKYWRPQLKEVGTDYDLQRENARRDLDRDRNDDEPTAYDDAIRGMGRNIVLSRPKLRLTQGELATAARIFVDVGLAAVRDMPESPGVDDELSDAAMAVRALGFEDGQNHHVARERLELAKALPGTLGDLATASTGSLTEAANAPRSEVRAARDDVRDVLDYAYCRYHTAAWILGRNAFGLRFPAWFAAKADVRVRMQLVLVWILMRRTEAAIWPSAQIAAAAHACRIELPVSKQLEHLWKTDARFAEILKPSRLKRAMEGDIAWTTVLEEIKSVTKSGDG